MVLDPGAIPLSPVAWPHCFRIIPSRFPPVQPFERVADADDLDAVLAIEALTNDRLAAARTGSQYILAPFAHPSPVGGRFTDGSYGAFYAARELRTAIAETVHHRECFLRATDEGPMELDMRVLRARLQGRLHDVRGMEGAIYDRSDYSASQALARVLRAAGSAGIVYDSVRHAGGECAAAFRPDLLSHCQQTQHLCYVWDGKRIASVYEKRLLPPAPARG